MEGYFEDRAILDIPFKRYLDEGQTMVEFGTLTMPIITRPRCLLNTCCCCIDLKIGSLVIGYMDLLLTLSMMWSLSFIPEGIENQHNTYVKIINGTTVSVTQTVVHEVPESLGRDAMITLYILNIVRLIAVIALLVGLHADKRKPVAAYLIYCVIFLVAVVTLFFVVAAIVRKLDHFIEIVGLFIGLVIAIFCIFMCLVPFNYFWWVILSQYYNMNSIDDQPVHHSSPAPPSVGQRPHRTTSRTTDL